MCQTVIQRGDNAKDRGILPLMDKHHQLTVFTLSNYFRSYFAQKTTLKHKLKHKHLGLSATSFQTKGLTVSDVQRIN